ncbi:MAG: twitching motility protein PilT [Actinomycetota bacterium]|jgi:twitching motility protein PilT
MVKAVGAPIDHLLRAMWEAKASDLLLTAGSPPLLRVDGMLRPLEGEAELSPDDTERLVLQVLGEGQGQRFQDKKQADFSFSWEDKARLRGNAFRQRQAAALALRMIPFEIPSIEELGLPEIVHKWVRLPHGFILVTGPTGSGKSTSLASMLDEINATRQVHILTIEDPIEYVHQHKLSAVSQREVGEDTDSFADGLRSALREDPDVVLVGEMRDPESIASALTIAETGHLVFATLHSNDTAQALDRIVDVFPGEQQPQIRLQLANTLIGILHQQLLPRVGGGRVAAFEVLVGTHAAANLIREGKSRQIRNVVATGSGEGMQTLESGLTDLVARGLVSHEDALARTLYPGDVKAPVSAAEPTDDGRSGRRRRTR